jgi:hypothetical protein
MMCSSKQATTAGFSQPSKILHTMQYQRITGLPYAMLTSPHAVDRTDTSAGWCASRGRGSLGSSLGHCRCHHVQHQVSYSYWLGLPSKICTLCTFHRPQPRPSPYAMLSSPHAVDMTDTSAGWWASRGRGSLSSSSSGCTDTQRCPSDSTCCTAAYRWYTRTFCWARGPGIVGTCMGQNTTSAVQCFSVLHTTFSPTHAHVAQHSLCCKQALAPLWVAC